MEKETCANRIYAEAEMLNNSNSCGKPGFKQIGCYDCNGSDKTCEYYFPTSSKNAQKLRQRHSLLREEKTETMSREEINKFLGMLK